MKLTTDPEEELTPDLIDMPDMVLQCTAPGVWTLRRKPIYPKGFSAMANALWKRESLEFRKKWKHLISGGDPHHQPIWEITIEIYRAVLYVRLFNNEHLHAAAPKRLPALQFDSFYGLPACNYATLSKPHKRQLRDRIALRRAELKRQAEAKRAARQAPTPRVSASYARLTYLYHPKQKATSMHRPEVQGYGTPIWNLQVVASYCATGGQNCIPP